MIDINSKVEKFCADYDMPVDEMDHPNSILTSEGDRVFISDEEISLIERIVMSEARGESCEAQEAVATVILNRWQEGSFGETISDVCYASGQFAAPWDGEISMSVNLAVKNAIVYYNTYCQDLPTQILYFRSDHYHTFGTPYISMGNLYFSARDGVIL
jgi:hypothetical protein